MDAIGNLLQQMLNAAGDFFSWIARFILLIISTITFYIPREYLLGGFVIAIMVLVLLRAGLKQK